MCECDGQRLLNHLMFFFLIYFIHLFITIIIYEWKEDEFTSEFDPDSHPHSWYGHCKWKEKYFTL